MPKRAWVYRRGKVHYVGWYDAHNARRSRSVGTLHQAEAYRRFKERQINSEVWVEPARMPWADYWAGYLADPDFTAKSPSTRTLHVRLEARFRLWCRPRWLSEITPATVAEYRRRRLAEGRSAATVNQDLRTLRYWLGRAARLQLIPSNPALSVPFLKAPAPSPRRPVTWAEYQGIRAACRPDDRAYSRTGRYRQLRFMVDLLWWTGLSSGDALLLEARQLDLDAGLLVIRRRKTGRMLELPLVPHPWFRQRLRRFLLVAAGRRGGLLFKGWNQRNMIHAWDRVMEAAGLPGIGRHDFRRAFVSHLAMAGVPLAVVKELVGHRSAATTERHYMNVDPAVREGISHFGPPRSAV